MNSRFWVLGLLGLVMGAGACSAKSVVAGSEPGRPKTAQEVPAAFAKSFCEAAARCCDDQHFAFDAASCEQYISAELTDELHEYDALRVDFDPAAAAACIADYTNAVCPSKPGKFDNVKHNCNLMFRGRVAVGEPCTDGDECQRTPTRSAYCDGICVLSEAPPADPKQGEPCGGTCRARVDIPDACGGTIAADDLPTDSSLPECKTSDGLQCWTEPGKPSSCQPLVAIGESCQGNSLSCVEGAFCNLDTRLCEAQRSSGPCSSLSDVCAADAVCDFDTLECVLTGKALGEPCSAADDCESHYCGPSSICQDLLSAEECVARMKVP